MLDANTRVIQGLGKVVDDQISWLSQWHQVAFYGGMERQERASALKTPPSFLQWVEQAKIVLPSQQSVLKRLIELHDQMHTSSRLVIMAARDGEALPIHDYEKILSRFDEFITALRRLERAFSEAAAGLDPLTGLRTRAGLQDDFNREMNRLKNAKAPFILALVDIDHFKNVNDTYGHEMGDRVLAAFTNCILRHIRTYDDAYRMGGEEFLLLMKGLNNDTAEPVLERLRLGIARLDIKDNDGKPLRLSASFGYVEAKEGQAMEVLIAAADKALYKAKQEGRNRVEKGSL